MAGKHVWLRYHLVWSTAKRQPTIDPKWKDELYKYLHGIMENKGGKLIIAGGMPDHIHLYISLPPTISISEIVGALKANSSRWIHETYDPEKTFDWQDGYGAFTVSKSLEADVVAYIRDQEKHHANRDYATEYLGLLRKHEVEFDERYVLD